MTLKFDIRSVADTAGRVALRFWPVLLVALAAWLCAMGLIWHKELPIDLSIHPNFENRMGRAMFVFIVGVATVLSGCLLCERASRSKVVSWAWIGASLLATGMLLWWFQAQELNDEWPMLRLAALGGCAHLLVAAAPFLGRGTESGFWQYNRILFIRLFTGALYTGTLMLGLTIAYVVTCELFGIVEDEEILGTLAATLAFLFHTWYFLAGVPAEAHPHHPSPSLTHDLRSVPSPSGLDNPTGRGLEAYTSWYTLDADTTYPKPLKLFTQFVLLPLVLIYLLILYAYMGKIILEQDWPKGLVSYLVFGFSILGILAFLLVWPLRGDTSSPTPSPLPLDGRGLSWIKPFTKGFYIALLPLTVLEALALAKRIGDYGLTEERVILSALTLWLIGATVAGLITGGRRIRYIPVSLAVAVFLICFGPLEASSISIKSQSSRLTSFLEQHGAMKGGKAIQQVQASTLIPEEGENLFSMLDYLEDHGRLDDWASEHISAAYGERLQAQKDSAETLWKSKRGTGQYSSYIVMPADSVAKYLGYDRRLLTTTTAAYEQIIPEDRTVSFATHGFERVVYPGALYDNKDYSVHRSYLSLDRNDSIYVDEQRKPQGLVLRYQSYRDTALLRPLFDGRRDGVPIPIEQRYVPIRLGSIEGEVFITQLSGNEESFNCNYLFLYRRK